MVSGWWVVGGDINIVLRDLILLKFGYTWHNSRKRGSALVCTNFVIPNEGFSGFVILKLKEDYTNWWDRRSNKSRSTASTEDKTIIFYMLAMQAYKKPATFQHYAKDCRAATNLPNGKPPFKIKYFNYGNIVLLPNREPADQPHGSKSSLIPPWDEYFFLQQR